MSAGNIAVWIIIGGLLVYSAVHRWNSSLQMSALSGDYHLLAEEILDHRLENCRNPTAPGVVFPTDATSAVTIPSVFPDFSRFSSVDIFFSGPNAIPILVLDSIDVGSDFYSYFSSEGAEITAGGLDFGIKVPDHVVDFCLDRNFWE